MARDIDITHASLRDFERLHMDTTEIPYRIITAEDVNPNRDYNQERFVEFLTAFYKARERKRGLRNLACYARESAGLLDLGKIYIADKTNPWIAVASVKVVTNYSYSTPQADYAMESYAIQSGNWDRVANSNDMIRSKNARTIINQIGKVEQQIKPAVIRAVFDWKAQNSAKEITATGKATSPTDIFTRLNTRRRYSAVDEACENLFKILDRLHTTQGMCPYEDLKILMPETVKMFEESKEWASEMQDFHKTLAGKALVNIVKLSNEHKVYFKIDDALYSINNPELTPLELQASVATLDSMFLDTGTLHSSTSEWRTAQGVGAKHTNVSSFKILDSAYIALVSNECIEELKQLGEYIEE